MQYEVYFRTSRGGIGIPYELAKTEFLAVYQRFGLELKKDREARHRMSIELALIPDRVAAGSFLLATNPEILTVNPIIIQRICSVRASPPLSGQRHRRANIECTPLVAPFAHHLG